MSLLAAGPAAATQGNAVLLGDDNGGATARTGVFYTNNTEFAVLADGVEHYGVQAASETGYGVVGTSNGVTTPGGTGVGIGVAGYSSAGTGVLGSDGSDGLGVSGSSASGVGVLGSSNGTAAPANPGVGVGGYSTAGIGVEGADLASGAGVRGESVTGFGVCGTCVGGTPTGNYVGVGGYTRNGVGVQGSDNASGFGVYGSSAASYGVIGNSGGAAGVYGTSTTYGGEFLGGLAPLLLTPATSSGPPVVGAHNQGELYVDDKGSVFVCTAKGEPGTWRQVVMAAPSYFDQVIPGSKGLAGSVNLFAAPIVVFQSEATGNPAAPTRAAGPLLAGSTTELSITGAKVSGVGVPGGAVGVIGMVFANVATASGNLRLFKAGVAVPNAVALSYVAGVPSGTLAIVPLSAAGAMSVYTSAETDITFTVAGFIF